MDLNVIGKAFRGKRVLITGHTGFKGSWLALWLEHLGVEVHGIALDPEAQPNHWDCLALEIPEQRVDICDQRGLVRAVSAIEPDFVFHLAAQAYVRRSYRDPVVNWQTNVMGTVNLLQACRDLPRLAGVLVVTTDKCYQNREWNWGYRENDPLGGHDPYSASKAATELVVGSYREAYFNEPSAALLASARAGNVIGGGDWSEDRLIPDVFRSIEAGASLRLRSPGATRPWQHILEALAGYLLLGERLLRGDRSCARAWNFGPGPEANRPVHEVLELLQRDWPMLRWERDENDHPHEASLLYLDSANARALLGWQPRWDLQVTIEKISRWYRAWYDHGEVISRCQIEEYLTGMSQ